MNVIPPALAGLISELSRLPGIGKKTASRLAIHLLRRPAIESEGLARSLKDLHRLTTLCSTCNAFSERELCEICADPGRSEELVCVVEEPADLIAIEKSAVYKGKYHILHGVLSPVDGIGPEELKIGMLLDRVNRVMVKEVLVATSSTVPGEATASYLIRQLKTQTKARVSRLACGIPMGMDVKYADELTLAKAIEGRQEQGLH